jgi:hypothetical protein
MSELYNGRNGELRLPTEEKKLSYEMILRLRNGPRDKRSDRDPYKPYFLKR